MTAFTVWKFETLDGAHKAAEVLEQAGRDGLVKIEDLKEVVWFVGEEPRVVDHHHGVAGGATLGGAGGLLLGAAFTVPLVGLAAGAALGAKARKYRSVGITEEQLEGIRGQLQPGCSALFAVTSEADLDRLGERFRDTGWKLVETNLTDAERENLHETFGGK